jgi:hypothetical protein
MVNLEIQITVLSSFHPQDINNTRICLHYWLIAVDGMIYPTIPK